MKKVLKLIDYPLDVLIGTCLRIFMALITHYIVKTNFKKNK